MYVLVLVIKTFYDIQVFFLHIYMFMYDVSLLTLPSKISYR